MAPQLTDFDKGRLEIDASVSDVVLRLGVHRWWLRINTTGRPREEMEMRETAYHVSVAEQKGRPHG